MASYFDQPDYDDDGAYIEVRFNELMEENHPAKLIKTFIDSIDVSRFEKKYKVGSNQKGRAPKGIKLMLGLILYGFYSRIFSAHKLEKASHTYADFWIFTHKIKISHDKICDFINLHSEDIRDVFLETILLAEKNNLLSFEALYVDGFYLKANASTRKSRTMEKLKLKEKKLSVLLAELLENMSEEDTDALADKKEKYENELKKISELKEELDNKIKMRQKGKDAAKAKKIEEKLTINPTDKSSDIMKAKKGNFENSYQKVCALDPKADIILDSLVDGYDNEPGKIMTLFDNVNENVKSVEEKYDTVVADSNFNTLENCAEFKKRGASFIAPTKKHENEKKKKTDKAAITFEYDPINKCVKCSEGRILPEKVRHKERRRNTILIEHYDKEVCKNCKRLPDCTTSKQNFRRVKIDARTPLQMEVVENYKSEAGQDLYKKRAHSGEIFQGDLKQNSKCIELLRRSLKKVIAESSYHDIVWNLRRIFNSAGSNLVMKF